MPAHENISNTPAENIRFLRIRDVMAKTGLSRSHLYHITSEGKFPAAVLLIPGGVSKGWVYEEVDRWCLDRIAERDQGVAAND